MAPRYAVLLQVLGLAMLQVEVQRRAWVQRGHRAQLGSFWRGVEPEWLDALLLLLESSKVVQIEEMRDVLPRLPSENLIPTWVPPLRRI